MNTYIYTQGRLYTTTNTNSLKMSKQVSETDFNRQIVSNYTDVAGEKLGGKVLSFSDEWFAEAANLIKPYVPIREAGKFVDSGAWYDGWETRRHNTEPADWVICRFGVAAAHIVGTEIDTAYFNGNHAPEISVECTSIASGLSESEESAALKNATWDTVITKHECGPSQKQFFALDKPTSKTYTHARLNMYPDGGIARFRLYGSVVPDFSQSKDVEIDLASVLNGGQAVARSDQHFGSADNLLLPGKGENMGSGWETKRSREPGHVDWVVIRLGAPGTINKIVLDTAWFKGNFPQKMTVSAVNLKSGESIAADDDRWVEVLAPVQGAPHVEKEYPVENKEVFSHVKLTIIPDGGVSRIRVFGNRAE